LLDQIVSFIQGHDRFVISTHISPDPDAVSSALAMDWLLRDLGKRTQIVLHDPVPRHLDFLPNVDRIQPPEELDSSFEQVILVDCGKANRVGDALHERFQGHYVLNIDHHRDNPRFGHLHLVREWSSCTLVIAELAEAFGVPLTPPLATYFYTGLVGDTNAFRNANVDASSLATAAEWVATGADPRRVALNLFERQSWGEVQLMSYALSNLEREGKIVWCALPFGVFGRYGVRSTDTDWIIAQLRAIDEVEIAILFKEIERGRIKVSLRAKGALSVNDIAQAFGGGGHVKAAGCLLKGEMDEVVRSVLAKARERTASPLGS